MFTLSLVVRVGISLVRVKNSNTNLKQFASSLHSSQNPFPEAGFASQTFLTNQPIVSEAKQSVYITPSLHHSITPLLHYSITPPLHHPITPQLQSHLPQQLPHYPRNSLIVGFTCQLFAGHSHYLSHILHAAGSCLVNDFLYNFP